MKEPPIEFYRESVEKLTGGDVTWRETIPVPLSWWRGNQIISNEQEKMIQKNVVHVFDIKRSIKEILGRTTSIRWMGETGVGYVWAYQRQNRWYYTRVFHNSSTGVLSPEDAVRVSSSPYWRPLR
jgi:hypothetical protein